MTTNEKTAFIQKMEKQRFSPITEETLPLYQTFSTLIDPHDPDELSYLLFYEGEYFFRIGNFNRSLNHLTRCLQAPKSSSLKYLDALSYNIIGLIYGYLGQESIAVGYLLQAKAASSELHLTWESAVCCANLGLIYGQLEIYDTALSYYNQAFEYAAHSQNDSYNLKVSCYACSGILYCKLGEYEKAAHMSRAIEELRRETDNRFYDVSVLNLDIRLFDYYKDREKLLEQLHQLLESASPDMDFLELSDFYFDVCSYLLEKQMKEECDSLFHYIEQCLERCPLTFPRYRYLKYRILYASLFSSEKDYLAACQDLYALRSRYTQEQCLAKLYSLEYVERLRQTKNDSEMFREKSRIDQMTGLLNKYTVQFLVEEDLAKSSSQPSAMILVDLDHFKQINDTLGHLLGDSFICQTGAIIQNYFKDNALCGRIGGDEFLVYISDATDRSFLILQAEILRQEIHRQTSERNITITTQASIGIAFSSEDCYDYESLFSAADRALYRAKLEGRNKVVVAE